MSWLWGSKKKGPTESEGKNVSLEGSTGKIDGKKATTTGVRVPGLFNFGIDKDYTGCDLSFRDSGVCFNGSKGCPEDVSCALYHAPRAMLFVGTTQGELFCYGNGFQFNTNIGLTLTARSDQGGEDY